MLESIKEFWHFFVGAVTAIGGLIAWYRKSKDKKKSSTQMLYEQLEELKRTLIARVEKDMERATSVAEKQHIIDTFRIHCPDCYISVMSKIYPDGTDE